MFENEPPKKLPKASTQEKWKKRHSWLLFTRDGMKCELCVKWEDSIKCCKNFQRAFLDGSVNYKSSAVSEHEETDQHLKSIESQEDYENQLAGVSRKQKKKQRKVLINFTLKQGFKRTSTKLFGSAQQILAVKGRERVVLTKGCSGNKQQI